MVRGLDTFKTFFKDYTENYIIIGGTACDIIIDDAGLTPRATRDIDIILVIEALSSAFASHFWEFVKQGGYEQRERSPEKLEYFRFIKPKDNTYPQQLELFSKEPDVFDIPEHITLTPIPVNDDITSLSAVLMDEDYYNFTLENSVVEDGIHRANTISLILLKAKAFLDLKERKESGQKIDTKNIRKHKTDVFRLALLLTTEDRIKLDGTMLKDFSNFIETVKSDMPDKDIFKKMQAGNIEPTTVLNQLFSTFNIT